MATVTPYFSIVTPLYNAKPFLRQAVASVINQQFTDWELIIVDDCSTDGSFELACSLAFSDNRIKIVKSDYNSGTAYRPREEAVELSTGRWIVELDADDFISSDYLKKIHDIIEDTDPDMVLGITEFFGETSMIIAKSLPLEDIDKSKIYSGRELVRYTINWEISTAGMAVKRDLYLRELLKDPDYRNLIHADELLAREALLDADKVCFSDSIYYYRLHSKSITHHTAVGLSERLDTARALISLIETNFQHGSYEYVLINRYKLEVVYRSLYEYDSHVKDRKEIMADICQLHKSIDRRQLNGWKSKFFTSCNVTLLKTIVRIRERMGKYWK